MLLRGESHGDLVCFTAAHKAGAMATFWKVDVARVHSAFLAFESITLAAVLLGPHDYHTEQKPDGSFSNTTGARYDTFRKAALQWKSAHNLVDIVVNAASSGASPRVLSDLVVTTLEKAWPKGTCSSVGKIGGLTFDRWQNAYLGFMLHPVSPTMGPQSPAVPFVDALLDAHNGVDHTATTDVTDAVIHAYTYEGGCDACELHPEGYAPPTFPLTLADGTVRQLEQMETKPRFLTSDVCQHFLVSIFLMEAAMRGT